MSSSASDLVLLLVPGNTRVLATKVTNKIVKDTQTQQKISHISKVQGGGGVIRNSQAKSSANHKLRTSNISSLHCVHEMGIWQYVAWMAGQLNHNISNRPCSKSPLYLR